MVEVKSGHSFTLCAAAIVIAGCVDESVVSLPIGGTEMDFDEVAKTLTIGVVSPQFRLWNGSDIKVDREDVFIGASSADGLLRWHSMRAGIPILVGSILGQAVEPGQRLVFCSGPRLPVEIELNARLDEGVVETTLLTNQTLPPCAPLS